MRFGGVLRCTYGIALLLASGNAVASDNAPVRYQVRQGDTLISLGERYLRAPQSYKIVQKQNRIRDPHAIPVGTVLLIPRSALRFRPASARLISVRGQVLTGASPAAVGQNLSEGAEIATGAASFVTLQLDNGSRISLPSNSNVRIRRLRHYILGDSLDYDFDVARGGLRSSVNKLRSDDDRYQVRTPKAVSAVRGTDFQSRFDPAAGTDFAEVVDGGLSVAAGGGAVRPLPAGNGLAVQASGAVITEALLGPPALQQPGKTQSDPIVRFSAADAANVRYSIASDAGFVEQVADVITANGTAEFAGIANGNYFIRARAISAAGVQGLPATFAFKRRLNSVTASAGQDDFGFTFRWVGEGSGNQRFHFQLFRNATDQVPLVDEAGLTSDQVTISDLPASDYYWRVGVVQYLDNEVNINWTPLEKLTVSVP